MQSTRPTKKDSLGILDHMLRSGGVVIDAVLDIGVQYSTPELMHVFRDAKHLLVEPAQEYFDFINENYTAAELNYELVQAACGKEEGDAILNLIDISQSGRVTHTSVSNEPTSATWRKIDVLTIKNLLDLYLSNHSHKLLKVDVDGIELDILEGAGNRLKEFDVIIVEAPISINNDFFFDRLSCVRSKNFVIWDIVDFCYYKSCLSQVDIVFVRKDVKETLSQLNPWHDGKGFAASEWITYLQN